MPPAEASTYSVVTPEVSPSAVTAPLETASTEPRSCARAAVQPPPAEPLEPLEPALLPDPEVPVELLALLTSVPEVPVELLELLELPVELLELLELPGSDPLHAVSRPASATMRARFFMGGIR